MKVYAKNKFVKLFDLQVINKKMTCTVYKSTYSLVVRYKNINVKKDYTPLYCNTGNGIIINLKKHGIELEQASIEKLLSLKTNFKDGFIFIESASA